MRTGRHPLLQGDYLVKKEQLRQVPQRAGANAGPLRRLANRKDVMARVHGTGAEVPFPASVSHHWALFKRESVSALPC